MPGVIFSTPSLSHSVSLDYLRSMMATQWALAQRGIPNGMIVHGGNQFIAQVRNFCVQDFLTQYPTIQDFFFLDDDIGWPAEKVIEFLDRPEDVLVGIYPKKSDEIDFPVELAVDPETRGLIERDGLVRARGVSTGFMRIKRHVLEKLWERAQPFLYLEPDGTNRECRAIFETGVGSNGWWWGEDYTFCQKWAEIGGEIWVDPAIEFSHRGAKKWIATLTDHLDTFRERAKALKPEMSVDMFALNAGKVEAAA